MRVSILYCAFILTRKQADVRLSVPSTLLSIHRTGPHLSPICLTFYLDQHLGWIPTHCSQTSLSSNNSPSDQILTSSNTFHNGLVKDTAFEASSLQSKVIRILVGDRENIPFTEEDMAYSFSFVCGRLITSVFSAITALFQHRRSHFDLRHIEREAYMYSLCFPIHL